MSSSSLGFDSCINHCNSYSDPCYAGELMLTRPSTPQSFFSNNGNSTNSLGHSFISTSDPYSIDTPTTHNSNQTLGAPNAPTHRKTKSIQTEPDSEVEKLKMEVELLRKTNKAMLERIPVLLSATAGINADLAPLDSCIMGFTGFKELKQSEFPKITYWDEGKWK
ncbi:hypothetical protein V5O48_013251 [Marasmius crinis-equi]|uniref:Uncharacterized protein n=1 Tax=Marasmius crinis-equi TaxID=585013 RepID=A0ABR3F0Q7_9AGAR